MTGYLQWVAPKCGPCVVGQDMMAPLGRQNTAHWGFVGKAERYDCGQCITRHAREYGFPPLDAGQIEVWNLWFLVQSQQRTGGMGDSAGLDFGVLPAVFDLEGIPQARRRRLFRQLVTLNDAWLAHRAKKLEEQRRAQGGPRLDV